MHQLRRPNTVPGPTGTKITNAQGPKPRQHLHSTRINPRQARLSTKPARPSRDKEKGNGALPAWGANINKKMEGKDNIRYTKQKQRSGSRIYNCSNLQRGTEVIPSKGKPTPLPGAENKMILCSVSHCRSRGLENGREGFSPRQVCDCIRREGDRRGRVHA